MAKHDFTPSELSSFAEELELEMPTMGDPDSAVTYVTKIVRGVQAIAKRLNDGKKASKKATVSVERAKEVVSDPDLYGDTKLLVSDLEDLLREAIFGRIEQDRAISVLLPDILSTIRGEVCDVRSLFIPTLELDLSDVEEDQDDDNEEDFDPAELRRMAKIGKFYLEGAPSMLAMCGAEIVDLPADCVTVKDRKKDKKVVAKEVVFNVPTIKEPGDSERGSTGGKPLSTSKWTIMLDGNRLPTLSLQEIAVNYCSTRTARVSESDLRTSFFARTGKKFPEVTDGPVTLTVPAGSLTLTPAE